MTSVETLFMAGDAKGMTGMYVNSHKLQTKQLPFAVSQTKTLLCIEDGEFLRDSGKGCVLSGAARKNIYVCSKQMKVPFLVLASAFYLYLCVDRTLLLLPNVIPLSV